MRFQTVQDIEDFKGLFSDIGGDTDIITGEFFPSEFEPVSSTFNGIFQSSIRCGQKRRKTKSCFPLLFGFLMMKIGMIVPGKIIVSGLQRGQIDVGMLGEAEKREIIGAFRWCFTHTLKL